MRWKKTTTSRVSTLVRVFQSWAFFGIGVVLLIILGVGVAREAWRSYEVSQQLTDLQQQITDYEQKNKQLSDSISYLNSPEYTESAAKERLGLKRVGERAVDLTQIGTNTTVATNAGSTTDTITNQLVVEEAEKNPLQKWWDYFFAPKTLSLR